MTLEKMKTVFAALPNCTAWSLQLLKINTSKQSGTSYIGREITLSPEGTLTSFVKEISDRYIDESKGVLSSYHDITEYDGSTVDKAKNIFFVPIPYIICSTLDFDTFYRYKKLY